MTHESGNSTETPSGEAGFQSLRQQMEQTRAALAGKLNALQKRMTSTIDTACDTVDETVHSATKSALDAVQVIKCTLDLKQQAKRHPWAMMGVATCIGALLAKRNRDQSPQQSPVTQRLGTRVQTELDKLKDEAISACANMVRHWMERMVQRLKDKPADSQIK